MTAPICNLKQYSSLIQDPYIYKCIINNSKNQLIDIKNKKPEKCPIETAYYHYACAKLEILEHSPLNAVNHLLISIETIPTEFRFWTLLSKSFTSLDENENSFKASLEAVTLEANPFTLDHLLIASHKIKNFYCFDHIHNNTLKSKENTAELLNLKAKEYRITQNYKKCIQTLQESYNINKNPKTMLHLAQTCIEMKDFESSLKSFKHITKKHADFPLEPEAKFTYLLSACFLNEWNTVETLITETIDSINKIPQINTNFAAFYIMSMSDDFSLHSKVANLTSKHALPEKPITLTEKFKLYENHKKIRIGYLSADIGQHIVSDLFIPRLKGLDREIFTPYVYSYRKDDGSKNRETIKSLSNFHDIEKLSDRDAAILISSHEIDILVDLTVFTSMSRSNIMTYRPAPIQLHHTGFPSTTGAPHVYDYMLVNKLYITSEMIPYYSESLIIQPPKAGSDLIEHIPSSPIDKSHYNLPSDKFILASFNQPYKITRKIFRAWCDILKQNPNTVLWIYINKETRKKNILNEIIEYGLDENRVFFADHLQLEEHKDRLHAADLLLDTFPYGNHSSAKYSLESGTPIIAYKGESQVSRISYVHLLKAGLNNLIASNYDEYISIANKYIRDKTFRTECLDTLKSSLGSSQDTNNNEDILIYQSSLLSLYKKFTKDSPNIEKESYELDVSSFNTLTLNTENPSR